MSETKKPSKSELRDIIEKRVDDKEIARVALGIAMSGEDVNVAIKEATEEIQSLKRAKPAKEDIERNKGRKRVLCELLEGVAKGRKTSYWEDIATRLQERGELKILSVINE